MCFIGHVENGLDICGQLVESVGTEPGLEKHGQFFHRFLTAEAYINQTL